MLAAALSASCIDSVDQPIDISSATLPALTSRRLSVDGSRLRDSLGREVILRGFNVGERSKMPPYLPFDLAPGETTAHAADDFFGRLATLGANVVRLTFSWEAYESTRGTYDAAYMADYRTLLDAADANGLAVIVDFHQDVFASPFCGDGFPIWTIGKIPHDAPHYDCGPLAWSLAALTPLSPVSFAFDRLWNNTDGLQDSMEEMWRRVASQLGSHPAVAAFEVMNEPASGNRWNDEMDGTVLPAFYERMGRAIHDASSSDIPVFWDARISTTGVPAAMKPPSLANAVFAPHYYEPFSIAGIPIVRTDAISSDLAATFAARSKWGVPVFLGEFGAPSGNPAKAAYLDAVLDTLDALRGHATMWDASASAMLWNGEDFSVLSANREEQPWANSAVRAYPRAIAGSLTSFQWNADTESLVLDVSDSTSGITEVYLPARYCGTQPQIGVTGAEYRYVPESETLLISAAPGASYHVVVRC